MEWEILYDYSMSGLSTNGRYSYVGRARYALFAENKHGEGSLSNTVGDISVSALLPFCSHGPFVDVRIIHMNQMLKYNVSLTEYICEESKTLLFSRHHQGDKSRATGPVRLSKICLHVYIAHVWYGTSDHIEYDIYV